MDNSYISPAQLAAREASTSRTGKKELLIKTGMELAIKNGYENVSVDDITAACGVAKGTFYYYFKSKNDLFNAGTMGLNKELLEKELRHMPEKGIVEQVIFFVRRYADIMENITGRDFNRLWARTILGVDEPNERVRFDVEMLSGLIEEAQESGELSRELDGRLLAKMCISYLYGASFSYDIDVEEMRLGETVELFCESIERLMRPYLL